MVARLFFEGIFKNNLDVLIKSLFLTFKGFFRFFFAGRFRDIWQLLHFFVLLSVSESLSLPTIFTGFFFVFNSIISFLHWLFKIENYLNFFLLFFFFSTLVWTIEIKNSLILLTHEAFEFLFDSPVSEQDKLFGVFFRVVKLILYVKAQLPSFPRIYLN